MAFHRFIRTEIFVLGANIYIADVLFDLITMVAEEQEESLITGLLVINNSDHCYVDQYIDSPLTDINSTEDEDCQFLKMINTLTNSLIKLVNENYELFEVLVDYLKQEEWVDIKGLTEGVIVYYGKRDDFNPHISGTKTLYPDFNRSIYDHGHSLFPRSG